MVAAPSYFDGRPKPHTPQDLLGHRCIRFRFASGVIYRWEFEKDGEIVEPVVEGPLIVSEDRLVLQAVLVRVLEDWCQPFDGFHVYYPSRRQMRPALRAFIDFFGIGRRETLDAAGAGP